MTKVQKEIRKLKRKCWQLLSKKIRDKAKHKCTICGSSKYLNVHHLEDAKLFPELFLDEHNLVCLCVKCHKWSRSAVHKSITATCYLLNLLPKDTIEYLLSHMDDNFKFTKEYLEEKLQQLKEK